MSRLSEIKKENKFKKRKGDKLNACFNSFASSWGYVCY